MARPSKAVVEYYPHIIEHSRSLKILLKTFGNKAYMFWYELLGLLGSTENHYFDINEEAKFEDFYTDCFITKEESIEILKKCAYLGMIDKELYENGILFSDNFLDNIRDAYNRRKINLLEKDAIRALLIQNKRINVVNVDINPDIGDNNPQSKVNESKQDEIIVKQTKIITNQKRDIYLDKDILILTSKLKEIGKPVVNAHRKLLDEALNMEDDVNVWIEVFDKCRNKGHIIDDVFKPVSIENMIKHYHSILEDSYGLTTKEETKQKNNNDLDLRAMMEKVKNDAK